MEKTADNGVEMDHTALVNRYCSAGCTTASGACALHIWPADGLEEFFESVLSGCSGPPLGRPAWLCPGPAKMEKKIAAKMLLKTDEFGFQMVPGRSKIALGALEVCWRPLASLARPGGVQDRLLIGFAVDLGSDLEP